MSTSPTLAKPLPVYQQISELLARRIKAGHWRKGERLPTEAELSRQLSVAVGTLRKSLALLEAQGMLERIQGSGTYVRATQGAQNLYEFFRLELSDGPGLPTALILSLDRSASPVALAGGSDCWRVRRLRLLNAQPVALEEIWFEAETCPTLTRAELGDSMYQFYQERFGFWIARVEDRLGVDSVPDWAVLPFGMKAGQFAGFVSRQSWTAANVLAEYSRTWFDPAVCIYTSRMSQ